MTHVPVLAGWWRIVDSVWRENMERQFNGRVLIASSGTFDHASEEVQMRMISWVMAVYWNSWDWLKAKQKVVPKND